MSIETDIKLANQPIHYYVHGRGRGHGTRTLQVVQTLEKAGFAVRIFAGEDPLAMIREVHPVEAAASLLPGRPFQWPLLLRNRIRAARAAIREERPLSLISDGDLPSLLAARIENIPSLAVGHAEVFGQTKRPKSAPRIPWFKEKLVAKISAFSAQHHVAVGFVHTEPLNRRTHMAGPAVVPILRKSPSTMDAVCYFRDDNGDQVVDTLLDLGLRVTLFTKTGTPYGNAAVRPLNRKEFLSALAQTRMVVASAGSQLISECTVSGLPLFALYRQNDNEQRLNVALLKTAGLGDGMCFENFTPARLRAFVENRQDTAPSPSMARPRNTVDKVVLDLIYTLLKNGRF